MAIPDKNLVGKNPQIVDGAYHDDYMTALNQFASVDDVFGASKSQIANGIPNPVAKLVMGTLGKMEYENHLVALVMSAAKSGEWRAVERKEAHHPGLDAVVQKHFGFVTVYEGKTFLLPSPTYIAYCNEQK